MFEEYKKILKSEYHLLWDDYCRYLSLGQDRFAAANKSEKLKQEELRLLEKAILKDFPLTDTLLACLQKAFIKHNLSLYLLLEPLQAWQRLALDKGTITEDQITEVVSRLASPAARMLMVLNDENPSTYLPITALLTAQFMIEAVQSDSAFSHKIKKKRRFWLGKIRGLLDNASVILTVVNSKRLKYLLALRLNVLAVQIVNMQNNKQYRSEWLDRVKIFLYSLYQFIVIRKRTTQTKGL